MKGLAFFDSNVLVYTDDTSDRAKQERARSLFESHFRQDTAVISLQVLQEYFNAATKKLKVAAEDAQRRVEIFSEARIVRLEAEDIIAAIELHRLTSISFWDALIVRAARLGGAAVLYTEDLQSGSVLSGVRIQNPFKV